MSRVSRQSGTRVNKDPSQPGVPSVRDPFSGRNWSPVSGVSDGVQLIVCIRVAVERTPGSGRCPGPLDSGCLPYPS